MYGMNQITTLIDQTASFELWATEEDAPNILFKNGIPVLLTRALYLGDAIMEFWG